MSAVFTPLQSASSLFPEGRNLVWDDAVSYVLNYVAIVRALT